jgi:hypothetical protein
MSYDRHVLCWAITLVLCRETLKHQRVGSPFFVSLSFLLDKGVHAFVDKSVNALVYLYKKAASIP